MTKSHFFIYKTIRICHNI